MADLPEETVTTVLALQRRLLSIINEATKLAWMIFEAFGETDETLAELEELHNIQEKATSYYIRLYRLLLQSFEAQPQVTSATLGLLAQSIAQTQAAADAGDASNRDIRRNWNL
ncbi:MAG: hypothetical protein ACFCU8_03030 [Thermosynechococcaceae cyanobacterium]